MQNNNNVCGRAECKSSVSFKKEATFGTGNQNSYGYFEVGCEPCARAHESSNPNVTCWPYHQEEEEEVA
jgi:hypothetical protein